MFWLIKKLLKRRKPNPATDPSVESTRPPKPRNSRPEWERTLLASLEGNNLAPSEDVILHAFDLYREDLYEPIGERRLVIADLYAAIVADVARLQGLVPDLIERAMSAHAFEFSHLNGKELR